jgi:Na+/H+ antiporter NhaD/arsenite permease-like protein
MSLFLSRMTLTALAMLAAVGMVQFLSYRANSRLTQIAFQTLKTHLPDSQGPKAIGSWLILITLLSIFLLISTSLRSEPLWIRLLFSTLTPFSTFCGISLLAVAAHRTR